MLIHNPQAGRTKRELYFRARCRGSSSAGGSCFSSPSSRLVPFSSTSLGNSVAKFENLVMSHLGQRPSCCGLLGGGTRTGGKGRTGSLVETHLPTVQ